MKVSILIPCYNAERWIAQAIRSALEQEYPEQEVIVVDDGSTDGSVEQIRTFGEQIRFEASPHRGGNIVRNRLLELARGSWLQYLDADDYVLPGKIAGQAALAEQVPDLDVIYSPILMEYWHDETCERREVLPIPEPRDPWALLARWQLPQTGTCLWRKAALEEVGGWRPDQPCCQEHELYFRLLAAGKRFGYHPDARAVYRQWSSATVCRRDPLLSFQKRLEVVDRLETHLMATGQLSELRRAAIAQARLECARSLYHLHRPLARVVAEQCRRQNPGFQPPSAPCFPRRYRWTYRLLGFMGAEWVADRLRPWRPRP